MPVPGDAACADARITELTDDSTDALHTADDDVPDGTLKDSVAVSTTVVGGTDDADGVAEGVSDAELLTDTVTLLTTEALSEGDTVEVTDGEGLPEGDGDTVADIVAVALEDADEVTLDEMLDDAELE